jgi:hypothetical protein
VLRATHSRQHTRASRHRHRPRPRNRGCEAKAAADDARGVSGGAVYMGHGEESEESEEEYDAWRTYYEIFDNNFDYDL